MWTSQGACGHPTSSLHPTPLFQEPTLPTTHLFIITYASAFPLNRTQQVGQKVNVRVIEADMEQRKLRLSMRENGADGPTGGGGGGGQRSRSTQNSVDHFLNLSPEEWIGGTVASITNFGAFVAVDADTDGLLHISQISDDHVDNVEDYLQVGQDVQVRVIDVDVDNARLGLSMREPRQNNNQRSRGSKDVSTLLGNDPDEFITGEVRGGWNLQFT